MNTSLQWLTDFLPGAKLDAETAGVALTNGGLPVEHFEQRGDDAGGGDSTRDDSGRALSLSPVLRGDGRGEGRGARGV